MKTCQTAPLMVSLKKAPTMNSNAQRAVAVVSYLTTTTARVHTPCRGSETSPPPSAPAGFWRNQIASKFRRPMCNIEQSANET